jgi:tetratricopeptide (TPR) repeat protein
MIAENPIFGGGFNSFANNYGKTQAAYFLNNTSTEKEIQVADYVTCAYNEFLEMLIDSGITGLLLFLLILCFALKPSLQRNSEYYFAARYALIAFLILSMVSYPFGLAPNILMLIFILFIIFNSGNYKTIQIRRFTRLISTTWFLLMLGLIYLNTTQTYGVYHFQKGYKKVINNDIESGLQDYKNANAFLENNPEFQFHYGSALNLNRDYKESIHHLKMATQLSSNPNAYIILGNSLKEVERYKEAEKAYKIASGITPSKLYPKYLLANLYIEMDLKTNALKTAQEIIEMTEKVKTTAGSEIKQEMKQLINKLQ